MSIRLAQATAAPIEVQIGGATYRMSPLTGRDIAELDLWLQGKVLRLAKEAIDQSWSEDAKQACWAAAMREAARITWLSPEGQARAMTLDGLARVIWLGLRRNHASLSMEVIQDALLDPVTQESLVEAWQRVNDAESPPGATAPKKDAG